MATLDQLVTRIDVATQKLEGDVNQITGFATNLETAVTDSTTQADRSKTEADRAKAIADSIQFPALPAKDGVQYVIKDQEWSALAATSDSVKKVNGKTPDSLGAVTITYTDVGALKSTYVPTWASITGKPTQFTSSWSLVADKPTTFTPSAHTHDAGDVTSGTFSVLRIPNLPANKITNASGAFALDLIPVLPHTKITGGSAATADQYLAGDGTWKTPSGRGGAVGYPITETGMTYNSVAMTNWPNLNPNEAINLTLVSNGAYTGNAFFANGSTGVSALPCGNYYTTTAMGASGVNQLPASSMITVQTMNGSLKRAYAFYQPLGGDTKGKMWVFRTSDSTWLPVNS